MLFFLSWSNLLFSACLRPHQCQFSLWFESTSFQMWTCSLLGHHMCNLQSVCMLGCTHIFCSICVYSDGYQLCVYLVSDLDGARGTSVEQARMDDVARAERVHPALTHSIMKLAAAHRPPEARSSAANAFLNYVNFKSCHYSIILSLMMLKCSCLLTGGTPTK